MLLTFKADCVLDVEAGDVVDKDIEHMLQHTRIANMPVYKEGRKSLPPVLPLYSVELMGVTVF